MTSRPALHRHVRVRALPDDDGAHAGARLESLVRIPLERDRLSTAPALVLGDQDLALHVVQTVGERLGGEPPEDDRVRSTEAGAREHRDRQADPHAHVDPHRRSLPDAVRLEAVRDPDDLVEELRVRDRLALVDRLTLPVERDLVTEPGLDVAIEAVVGDVELAADVPLRVREIPVEKR